MGVNNRQRRAAKRRKRLHQHRGRPAGGGVRADGRPGEAIGTDERLLVGDAVQEALEEIPDDGAAARRYAEILTGSGSPVSPRLVADVVGELLSSLVVSVVRGGWAPSDLAQLVTRRLRSRHLALLATLLIAETDRHPAARVAPAWRADLAALPAAASVDLTGPDGVECALELAAVLARLPAIAVLTPPPGVAADRAGDPAVGGADSKMLARVRSLLAKAESTDYSEEAETLSAKAQELISRYALDRLLHEAERQADDPVTSRRLWIDPPYVVAKGMLVDAVASANRCRSVISEHLGFCSVVGQPGDLSAVELLVTSLLVQADAAMLRHGRHVDEQGRSRTASFRRAFLIAYAGRIRERLQAATRDMVEESGRTGELVPVLRRQSERVDSVTEEMFPEINAREVSISNGRGWAAGRAAADLALLDTDVALTEPASG